MRKEELVTLHSRLFGSVAFTVLWCVAPGPATYGAYAVQYGPFASQAQEMLAESQLSPVITASDEETPTVLVGRFEYCADALVARKALDPDGVYTASVRELGEQGQASAPASFTRVATLSRPIFEKSVSRADQLPVQSMAGNSYYEQLQGLDKPATRGDYKQALQSIHPTLPDTNPLKGYVAANLGIQAIVDKDYEAALEYLLPVANGEIASAADHRVMAMNRAAWLTHWKKDRLRAYRAYREVQDFTTLQSVRDSCEVECIGLLMELAESGRGTHEEVRAAAAKALTTVPETNVKSRATIELMNLRDLRTSARAGFRRRRGAG